jgi:hypothetical protein
MCGYELEQGSFFAKSHRLVLLAKKRTRPFQKTERADPHDLDGGTCIGDCGLSLPVSPIAVMVICLSLKATPASVPLSIPPNRVVIVAACAAELRLPRNINAAKIPPSTFVITSPPGKHAA